MARKAHQKVRTGCITCKARRVKCDETHPRCIKCTSTGRECDGYRAPPPGSFSWDELLYIQPCTVPDADRTELRSLAFFREAVAPVLSGPLGRSFWTGLVNQAAHQEPAARHAAVAISALYEQFGQGAWESVAPYRDGFAIQHYNRAIKSVINLQEPKSGQLDSVIIVCVLFDCIEFLRGNTEAAVQHYRYGIRLLNSTCRNTELLAIFRHLSIFPLFFVSDLSTLPPLSAAGCPSPAGPFRSLAQAQESMDWLTCQGLKLARERNRQSLVQVQKQIDRSLNAWSSAMAKFKAEQDSAVVKGALYRMLEVRWLLCKMWVNACTDQNETTYDKYMDNFERIVEISQQVQSSASDGSSPPRFAFEMGFAPLLYFVVIKCRNLSLRLKALSLMKTISCPREMLWDSDVMTRIGLQIIEKEHGIKLTPGRIAELKRTDKYAPLPPEDCRIRDSVPEEEDMRVKSNSDGANSGKSRLSFHCPTAGNEVEAIRDGP
ncbi:4'-phosphopantetheinyl transferase [Penicillium alfredii]|uniref:4'-phosphopantetheinyl transferase n=1 Tax=Penicillium alfredii TaxID=1506179 RepID=A0A9W9F994_9EURO|nr:4'-phosphopantetheinyl transferase [Penicillium alfredii]KAJ5095961.1 4'-phosphopantetheinyl transferase [Penicillium alfredii]